MVVKDRRQIELLTLNEFKRINFYYPWNHEKTDGFQKQNLATIHNNVR